MSGKNSQMKGFRPATPHTNRKGGYQHGEHLVVCDRSGKIYDSSNVRKEWNGLIVGRDEWEERHPQEFRRGIREDIAVKEARPGSPKSIILATTIDDVTAVSGGVAGGVYTSGASGEARPFVYWTLDLASELALTSITLAGLAISIAGPPPIRRGFKIGYSSDGVSYTDFATPIGAFGDGLEPAARDYYFPLNITARYLRLALAGGRGLGFSGTLTQTGLTVTRDA